MSKETNDRPRIDKLNSTHSIDAFDCGQDSLNRYLKKFALMSQRADGAQTYVGIYEDDIIGYYTLVVGHVAYEDAPERLIKGLSRNSVPVMLLARLATDLAWQGKRCWRRPVTGCDAAYLASCRYRRYQSISGAC